MREWDELLSVFGDGGGEGIKPSPTKNADNDLVGAGFTPARAAASEVLRELIDARLLTSYEVREDEHEPIRRVEIIHESLLANWPRLVRWQTQDQEGAQLRDELRQAARTWDEHGRTDDLSVDRHGLPGVRRLARALPRWADRDRGGVCRGHDFVRQAPTAAAAACRDDGGRRVRCRRVGLRRPLAPQR